MWFPEGKDDPNIALLRVKIEKAEYWDSPSSPISYALNFVSALVTGDEPDNGEHKSWNSNRKLTIPPKHELIFSRLLS